MAKVVGEVAIDVTADVGPLARQMKKGETSLSSFESRAVKMAKGLGSALGIGVVSAGAMGTAMVALARQSMQAIDAQAKLAQSLGTTVSSMQTLQRAGELAGVSMGGIQQATGDLTRRLAQAASGTGPVADALGRLNLSALDLAKVPLDQRVLQINEALDKMVPAAERAAVAGQLFGEEGSLAMARIDTATLRQATEDVHRFGVVVSEQDADQIEVTNDAMSRLGLVVEGLGNRLAVSLAPAMEVTANRMAELAARILGSKTSLEEFFGTLENARSILGDDIFGKLVEDTGLVLANLDQLGQIEGIYEALRGTISSTSDELARYVVQLRAVGESPAAEAVDSLVRSMDDLQSEFEAGNITAEEFERRMVALQAEAKAVVVELGNIDAVGFGGVIDRLGVLGGALAAATAEARKLRAALPGGPGQDTGTPLSGDVSEFMPPSPLAPTSSPRPERPGVDSYGDFSNAASGAAGGAGGGGSNPMTARVVALVESLKTEQEILTEWYAQSLEALNAASEAELLAVGGKHEALERLEREHQERLMEIMGSSQQQRLGEMAGFFGALASVTAAGGGKLAKAAATFAAVEGTINAYRAALQAMADPTVGFWGKFAAYASVLAAGLKGVAAIKAAGKVSGGGSAGGGSSAPQPPPGPTQTFVIDAPGMNLESFVKTFNDAVDAGYRPRIVQAGR